MKIFFRKSILFIIPLLILGYGMDLLLSSVLKKSNSFADGEYPVWNDLMNGTINSEVVIYGSSRALVHIDPAMISEKMNTTVYNLGVNGHSFKSQYFRHFLLLKYNLHPRLIIQTLDVTSFDLSSDFYNPDQYLPYMLNNNEMKNLVHNSFKAIDYKIPLIRYYGKKEALLEVLNLLVSHSSNKQVRIRGYQAKDLVWNDDLMKAQEKLGLYKVKADSALIRLFENYLSECKRNGIKVIFVNTPVFIEGQKFIENWSEIMDLYNNISEKYYIHLLDYSKDPISFKKEYFYNSGHLNKTGAELLTNKLIRDIITLNILN